MCYIYCITQYSHGKYPEITFLTLVLLLAFCFSALALPAAKKSKTAKEAFRLPQARDAWDKIAHKGDSVPGEVRVEKVSNQSINPLLGVFSRIKQSLVSTPDLFPIYKLHYPENTDLQSVIQSLKNDPNVVYAQPNYKYQLFKTPNDPVYISQWGLHNTGQTGGKAEADIHAPEAWDICTGSDSV